MGFFDKLKKIAVESADLVGNAAESVMNSATKFAQEIKSDLDAQNNKDWHERLKYHLSHETIDDYVKALRLIDFHEPENELLSETWQNMITLHPEMTAVLYSRTHRLITSSPIIWTKILEAHDVAIEKSPDEYRESISNVIGYIQCMHLGDIENGKSRLQNPEYSYLFDDLEKASTGNWISLEKNVEDQVKTVEFTDNAIKAEVAQRLTDYAISMKSMNRALEILARASRTVPSDDLKWRLAILYRDNQDWNNYSSTLETEIIKCAESNVEKIDIYSEIIRVYRDITKQHELYFKSCEKLFEIDPGNDLAHECLILNYEKLERWKDLIHVLDTIARDLEPDQKIERYIRIADIFHIKLTDNDNAEKYCEKVLEIDPKNLPCLDLVIELYSEQNQWEKLLDALRKKADLVNDTNEQIEILKKAANIAKDKLNSQSLSIIIWNYILNRDCTITDGLNEVERFCATIEKTDENKDESSPDNQSQEEQKADEVNPAQESSNAFLKGLKYVSGVHAFQQRKSSQQNKAEADKLSSEILMLTKTKKDQLNGILESFGKYRLEAMHNTIGEFLKCLEQLQKLYQEKEFDFLKSIDIQQSKLDELKAIDMRASDALKTAGITGGFGVVALAGTPALVTSGVAALATASTGTAISSLSGAAAQSAVLAWLGGGSLAAGGGGMAAGAAVLTGITVTAASSVALLALGATLSAFYSKKNTESEQYLADVCKWAADARRSWVAMDGIKERVFELQSVTRKLEIRSIVMLEKLNDIINHGYDKLNMEHNTIFQQCAILAKTMSELAKTPILDQEGNFNTSAKLVISETEKVLNKEFK